MKVIVIDASGLPVKPVIQHMEKSGLQIRLYSISINQKPVNRYMNNALLSTAFRLAFSKNII